MISLTIAGTGGTVTAADTGTSGYVILTADPGLVSKDNVYAESRWLDGASLVSSRTELSSLSVTMQVWGTSLADMQSKVSALGAAVDAFDYTVTISYTGGSAVYDAMPASYSTTWDPNLMRKNMALVALSIPVQP